MDEHRFVEPSSPRNSSRPRRIFALGTDDRRRHFIDCRHVVQTHTHLLRALRLHGLSGIQRPTARLGVAGGRSLPPRPSPRAACRAEAPRAGAPPRLRRRAALALFGSALAFPPRAPASESPTAALQREATDAYELADFPRAYRALSRLCDEDPANRAKWLEGRAQVGVDLKKFNASVTDYGALLSPLDARGNPAPLDSGAAARFHAGRALAHEGLYQWAEALEDYEATLALAKAGNFAPTPTWSTPPATAASLGDYAARARSTWSPPRCFKPARVRTAPAPQRPDGAVYARRRARSRSSARSRRRALFRAARGGAK